MALATVTEERLVRRPSLDLATGPRQTGARSVVSSHTEWDTLEEVVVGRLTGGVFPSWQDSMYATMPESSWRLFQDRGGSSMPPDLVDAADRQLETFAHRLEREGVRVVRPDVTDYSAGFATPDWDSRGGLYCGMPRDLLIVVGDRIIEAPMSWRCRHYEINAYRSLIKSYFRRGARWLPAPRPELRDDLFTTDYDPEENGRYAVTEFEPVFDAADFVRFGRDILVQRSHVTNEMGIRWLQQAVGDDYRVRCVDVNDPHAMHIDAPSSRSLPASCSSTGNASSTTTSSPTGRRWRPPRQPCPPTGPCSFPARR
jgi:glycine amidinotransferase